MTLSGYPNTVWRKPWPSWGPGCRRSKQPFVKLIVHWDNVDFRSVICSEDTAFLKRLCQTFRERGLGKTLEEVGNLQVDF